MDASRDVVIVGGGAIGLCSAYYLNRQGAAVTVIDRGEMGHGCSLHNAGYVCPSHFVPLASPGIIAQGLRWMLNPVSPFYLKPRLNAGFPRWAWLFRNSCTDHNVRRSMFLLRDLGNASLRLYRDLAYGGGLRFEFSTRGLLILYRTGRGERACREEHELASEVGIRAELLDAARVGELDSGIEMKASGGLYFPDDCHITPAKFVQSMVASLEEGGVKLLPHTEVEGFEVSGGRIRAVRTRSGPVGAGEFVLAGGAWSPRLLRQLGVRLLLEAGKGYSVTIRRAERKPSIPVILNEARVAITPMGENLRVAGTMELAGLDLSITRRRVEAMLGAVPAYLGGIRPEDFREGEVWAGLRPVSPDGLPYIGRFKSFSNLIAATGHAMIGISLAPVTGMIVSDLALGRSPAFDIRLLDPGRYQ